MNKGKTYRVLLDVIAAEMVDDDTSDVIKLVNVDEIDDDNDVKDVCNVETELDNEAIC